MSGGKGDGVMGRFEDTVGYRALLGTTPPDDDTPAPTAGKYAEARRVYDAVKRDGQRVLTLPEIQRVIDARRAEAAPDLTALPTVEAVFEWLVRNAGWSVGDSDDYVADVLAAVAALVRSAQNDTDGGTDDN